MKLSLTLIFGLLLSQLGLSGVAARSTEMPACHMTCCEPQVAVSCCDEQAVPEPDITPVDADCACAAHSRQPVPTAPAPQPKELRVDLQIPAATVVALLPRPRAAQLIPPSRQLHAATASHNTIQALKGVWRT